MDERSSAISELAVLAKKHLGSEMTAEEAAAAYGNVIKKWRELNADNHENYQSWIASQAR